MENKNMNFKDAIKSQCAEQKAKKKIYTCPYCGSDHGCNCNKQLSEEMKGNSISGYGYGYPRD